MSYNNGIEIITFICGVIAISKTIIWAYDSKVSTEREREMQKLKNEFLVRQDELQARMELLNHSYDHTVQLNTQAMQYLTDTMGDLKETIRETQDKLVYVSKEQVALRESVKSAHKRITEMHDRGCNH